MKNSDDKDASINIVPMKDKQANKETIRSHVIAAIRLAVEQDRFDVVADLATVIDTYDL